MLSAAELDRVKALYAPLAEAVRDLIDATIWTEADDDVVEDARAAIEAVTRSLREKTRPAGSELSSSTVTRFRWATRRLACATRSPRR